MEDQLLIYTYIHSHFKGKMVDNQKLNYYYLEQVARKKKSFTDDGTNFDHNEWNK